VSVRHIHAFNLKCRWYIKRLEDDFSLWVPVVINADLIIEGLHPPRTDLMNAAAPDTCGQDIDVPDFMPNMDGFFPIGTFSFSGMKAANIETPGAMTSGLQ